MIATIYRVDGSVQDFKPKGKYICYEEMREIVGGMVEILPLPSGKEIIVNEEGKLNGLLKNEKATEIWKKEYPIEKYPDNNDELIVGNAIVCDAGLIEM